MSKAFSETCNQAFDIQVSGSKKDILWKNWFQLTMPLTKKVAKKYNIFFNANQKRNFRDLKYSTKYFMHLTQRAQKYIEKQPNIIITLHKTQTLPENAVLLQTNWEIVASVYRIVPKYWIAFCKTKSYPEAFK